MNKYIWEINFIYSSNKTNVNETKKFTFHCNEQGHEEQRANILNVFQLAIG